MEQIHGGDIYRYKDVIDFSANVNPYGPPEGVIRAVKDSAEKLYCYPDVSCGLLRENLAEKENIPREWLTFGNGAAELLFALSLALKPGRALIQSPSFAEYERALVSVDCGVLVYQTDREAGFHIREDILEQITEELDLLILCNPNNPTGTGIDQELLLKILEKCQRTGVHLLVDECFQDFAEHQEMWTLKPYLKQYPMLFLLRAFTKMYAVPAIRLGYAMTSDTGLLEKIDRVTQPWRVSSAAQAAGVAALCEEEYVRKSRKKIAQEKARMIEEMRNAGYVVYESAANYIFFEGPENLWETCLERGLLIRDCSNYRGLSKGYYRAAVKRPGENNRLLTVLKEVVAWQKQL